MLDATDTMFFFQGSYGIVKLAYNEEDDTHYVSNIFLFNVYYITTCFVYNLISRYIASLLEYITK